MNMPVKAGRSVAAVCHRKSAAMLAAVAVPAMLACHAVQAQQASNVVLYGLLDTGIEYISHAGPDGGVLRMSSGNLAGSRW